MLADDAVRAAARGGRRAAAGTPSTSTRARSRSGWRGSWSTGGWSSRRRSPSAGYRTLPLDPDLVAALRVLRKQQAAERLAAGQAYEASGYVAVDELGAPVHPEWLTDEFGRIANRAGLPRIRLHDARHSMNSLLAAAGVPDHMRAAWCGHTVAVNVSTYTHARPEDLAVARPGGHPVRRVTCAAGG